jgi:hypothetical protein
MRRLACVDVHTWCAHIDATNISCVHMKTYMRAHVDMVRADADMVRTYRHHKYLVRADAEMVRAHRHHEYLVHAYEDLHARTPGHGARI